MLARTCGEEELPKQCPASEGAIGLVMMAVAGRALVGNLACLGLLMKHRAEDVNMRSVWLCSRNDVIGNVGVIASGALGPPAHGIRFRSFRRGEP